MLISAVDQSIASKTAVGRPSVSKDCTDSKVNTGKRLLSIRTVSGKTTVNQASVSQDYCRSAHCQQRTTVSRLSDEKGLLSIGPVSAKTTLHQRVIVRIDHC